MMAHQILRGIPGTSSAERDSASPAGRPGSRHRLSRSSFVVNGWSEVIAVAITVWYQGAVLMRDALHRTLSAAVKAFGVT